MDIIDTEILREWIIRSTPWNYVYDICDICILLSLLCRLNTLRPRQNGCHFPDDIFEGIFLNKNEWISLKISLKFVPKVRINNIPALVQIMAWRRRGDKPLSEPMMVSLLTHICVTRPQWFKEAMTIVCHKDGMAWNSYPHYFSFFFGDPFMTGGHVASLLPSKMCWEKSLNLGSGPWWKRIY